MIFMKEVHEAYQQAHALAEKSLARAKKYGMPACPAALNALADDNLISYRMDLGILDIPVSLVVGVAEANENTALYTKEFFPRPLPNSEFAEHWREIDLQFSCEEMQSGEIECIEYLGRFYVCDGLKRISVLKFHNASTVRSHVTRIVPIRIEAKAIEQYYAFLSHFSLTNLYQLQFTQPGYFEKLQTALGKKPPADGQILTGHNSLRYGPKLNMHSANPTRTICKLQQQMQRLFCWRATPLSRSFRWSRGCLPESFSCTGKNYIH